MTFEGPHGVANNSFDSIRPAGLAMAVQAREDIGLAHSKAADFDREEADGLGEGQVSFAQAVGAPRSPRAGEEARMPGINGTLGDMCMRKVHTDANPDRFEEREIAALRDWFTDNYWKVKQPGRGEPDICITFAFSGAAHRLIESNRPTEANPRPLEGTTVVVMDYEDPIKNPLRERYEAAIAEYGRRFRIQS